MTSEPSAVQRRDFRHTAATTLSWHSGSTTRATGSRSHSRRTGSSMRRATVLFRTEGSAGNVLAVGLARRGRHHADPHLRGRRRNLSGPERRIARPGRSWQQLETTTVNTKEE